MIYGGVLLQQQGLAERRANWPTLEERPAIPPPRTLHVLAGGFNEALADFYWARTLVYFGTAVAERKPTRDTEGLVAVVNGLDAKFRRPYVWGGYSAAFTDRNVDLKDADVTDSIKILERGIVAFPNDWELHWLLGLRYYLDVRSPDPKLQRAAKERGIALIERAMRLPKAPANIATLATTLRSELGQKERALKELRELILTTEDEAARKQLLAKYHSMATAGTAQALEREGAEFMKERKEAMPYAPQAIFVLVGAPVPTKTLAQLAEPPDPFREEPELEPASAPKPAPLP